MARTDASFGHTAGSNSKEIVVMDFNTKRQLCRIDAGLAGLTSEQLEVARTEAARQRISLRESILKLGLVSEKDLLRAVAAKAGMQFLNVTTDGIEQGALEAVSANIASHYNIVPLRITDDALWVATCDPFNHGLRSELELVLDNSHRVELVLATSEAISKAIRKSYGVGAATVEQMVSAEQRDDSAGQEDLVEESKAREASVIKLVNQLLADAISDGATDIHIEPYEKDIKVRYRVDGMLHDAGTPDTIRYFRDGITSRIKIISALDIAEKRLPQDGRAQVNLAGHKFDLRVSILPTRYGEAVNIRILPQSTLISDLPALGMTEEVVSKLTSLIFRPHGIVLVTGPTGSGKTTTLYTCMNLLLKHTENKILTIEDPVEYDMPGIVQMQVHPEIGFTFARALRSMLRHDPDIMLVGEIRDLETAETAIRTALTGHLVFSTLHTNDAASAITRLLDMGIEPYLIASSVEAILAQRLVRVICPNCKQPHEPDPEVATAVKSLTGLHELPTTYRGRGCSKCRFTGFHGRTAITELLVLSDRIRELTISRRHANEVDAQARREGMTSLMLSGLEKAHSGVTTYEEVLRATKGTVLME
jgi:general secretion pathway protein E/type IV pilus assembly protein PilB